MFFLVVLQAALVTAAVISGIALVPIFPLALELIAETTYPVNPAISTAIVLVLPVSAVLIGAELGLNTVQPQSQTNGTFHNIIQTCSKAGDTAHEVAKDYTSYINFLIGCAIAAWVLFVFWFFPKMKRSRADQSPKEEPVKLEKHKKKNQIHVQVLNKNLVSYTSSVPLL